jgi:CheY-like chemotaxis protein
MGGHLLNCVMLIDDDEPTNYLNRVVLEEAKLCRYIHVAQSAVEALNYLSQTSASGDFDWPLPELIFLDINMPAIDGWKFLEKYRQLPDSKKAKVIIMMLTTSLNPEDEIRAGEYPEVSGFYHKPLTVDDLLNIRALF